MMIQKTWSEKLWGLRASSMYLFIAAGLMLLAMLGTRELWTQEHRWADIVSGMFYRQDFLHPYLGETDYYDKPLFSYWLIAAISFLTQQLSTWTLRLPSALAGLLAVWSIYRIGLKMEDKRLGLLAGWMLVTTFYFIFWARTSSADMLNMAGSLFAVSWYLEKRDQPGFFNYAIFFLILALTSLCKGLIGAIVPLIVIFPDLLMQSQWKKHLRLSFFFSMVPAIIVYALPFWASGHFGNSDYHESGLSLVYRENVLRYFQPFDHKGPIYTYFLYLPIYLLPWAVFFIPTVWSLKSRWRTLSANGKWMCWAVLLLFVFLTMSGSRRNYYILPVVPFAILMTADWILSNTLAFSQRYIWAGRVAIVSFIALFMAFGIVQPLYYSQGGMSIFAADLKEEASKTKSWSEWEFGLLDPESKVRFYLQLPPTIKEYSVPGNRSHLLPEKLLKAWPLLKQNSPNMIYITRKIYVPFLQSVLPKYRIVEAKLSLGERLLGIKNEDAPVAFVP